jgi:Cobalamin synthesis protein cobW C-terminal domain
MMTALSFMSSWRSKRLSSVVLPLPRKPVEFEPLDWMAVSHWLAYLRSTSGEDLLRVKGILNLRGEQTPVVIHGAGRRRGGGVRGHDAWQVLARTGHRGTGANGHFHSPNRTRRLGMVPDCIVHRCLPGCAQSLGL